MSAATVAAWTVGSLAALLAAGYAYTRWQADRARDRHPPEGTVVTVDGVRLHLVRDGEGPTVLMLHGLAGFLEDFTHPSMVAALADGFDAAAVDRPGYGASGLPDEALVDLRRQADLVAALLDALDADDAILVGHSLGGALALAAAVRHPDRVRGLVLVAPYAYPRSDPDAWYHGLPRLGPLRRLVATTVAAPLARLVEPHLVHASFEPRPLPAVYHERWLDHVLQPDHLETTLEELRRVDPALGSLTPRYADLSLPVAILAGTADASVDTSVQARRLARELPDAELTVLEGEGHMLLDSHPELVEAAVRDVHERALDREADREAEADR